MCPFFSTCMAFVYIIITSPLGYPGLSKRAPAFCLTGFCPMFSTLLPCFKYPVVPYSVRKNAYCQVDFTYLLTHWILLITVSWHSALLPPFHKEPKIYQLLTSYH